MKVNAGENLPLNILKTGTMSQEAIRVPSPSSSTAAVAKQSGFIV